MDPILFSIPSPYTRFRLCENSRNPQAVAGFWPPLFDFRGQAALTEVVPCLNVENAYKTLGSILIDAYTCFNVLSISFKKIAHYPVSRLIFSLNMASCHFDCFLPPKPPIFGPTWTWHDTWMVHKSVQHIYFHCLGCVLVHFPVSRLIFLSIWHPVILAVFYPQNHPFSDPPGPGMTPGWCIKVSNTSIPIAWDVFWPIIQFPG